MRCIGWGQCKVPQQVGRIAAVAAECMPYRIRLLSNEYISGMTCRIIVADNLF